MNILNRIAQFLVFSLSIFASPISHALDNVTIGTVGSASANLWPVYIGINKGFFAAESLKVDIVFVQSSANLVQQLAAGSLDITMSTGLVDPIRAIDQRAPLAIVRLEVQAPPYALLAKPAIKSLKELKGKVISLGGPKDITKIYVERMLAPHGIKPGEFDMVFAGATSARATSKPPPLASTSLASPSTMPATCRFPAPWSIAIGPQTINPSCSGFSRLISRAWRGSTPTRIARKP
jgi:NitT/TauT family transport system substrate-binding protein